MIWVIFNRNKETRSLRFVRAEKPCYKGELTVVLLGTMVNIGWEKNNV